MPSELLALYDHDERFAAINPGMRREELPELVRYVDLVGTSSAVIFSRLSADTADSAIQEQRAYFASLNHDFEWKTYAHDQPPDLTQRLAAHGFAVDETEAIMVLDLQPTEPLPQPPPSVTVVQVHHRETLGDVAEIRRLVYGDDRPDHVERLAREMEEDPEYLSVYVAYVHAEPAACGWIRFPKTSAFASLWGGSTVPELRGRGLYTALLYARIQEARARGWRYLTVDARHMSRPILEKRGFQLLTSATACTWSPS